MRGGAVLVLLYFRCLLVALIGACVWYFKAKCQLQISSVINSAAGWLILAIVTIVYAISEKCPWCSPVIVLGIFAGVC